MDSDVYACPVSDGAKFRGGTIFRVRVVVHYNKISRYKMLLKNSGQFLNTKIFRTCIDERGGFRCICMFFGISGAHFYAVIYIFLSCRRGAVVGVTAR